MKIIKQKIELETIKQVEFIDVTHEISEVVETSGIVNGTAVIFSPHTTASIAINHNEPMLLQDMMRILYRMVPIDERYSHDMFELSKNSKSDGRSNAHSHCKSLILSTSETIPVENRELLLGKNQSIFFVELDGGRKRDFIVQVMGE